MIRYDSVLEYAPIKNEEITYNGLTEFDYQRILDQFFKPFTEKWSRKRI